MSGGHYPYRVVAETGGGDRRVYYARRLFFEEGMVEVVGAIEAPGRTAFHVRIPMGRILFIEESRGPVVRRGWIRPKAVEEPEPGRKGIEATTRTIGEGGTRRRIRGKPQARLNQMDHPESRSRRRGRVMPPE